MKIIDNILSLENYNYIVNTLFGNEFGWYFSNYISNKKADDGYYFVHHFYDQHASKSNHIQLINPILEILNPKAIIRIKANLYPSSSKLFVHGAHVDQPFPHNGAVYYVNSNDGYTELEDGTKIESIANRLVLFDSSKTHRSTGCTNAEARVTINFNYF